MIAAVVRLSDVDTYNTKQISLCQFTNFKDILKLIDHLSSS